MNLLKYKSIKYKNSNSNDNIKFTTFNKNIEKYLHIIILFTLIMHFVNFLNKNHILIKQFSKEEVMLNRFIIKKIN